MKIQGLAIIFVIIILPISLVLGEYINTQIDRFKLEQQYDSNLINATDDALKAFQINAFNDATSDMADSKIKSIEASVNTFYNSMESSFGLQGYSKEDLQKYVPALVYTMYDGYYIYSPYTNIAKVDEDKKELNINLESTNIEYGLKPYVYYSCRYKMGTDSDFIINYSLDNYITIQGTVDGKAVYESGYILTIANSESEEGVYKKTLADGTEKYYYSGQEINAETALTEQLVEANGNKQLYKYIKINGTKYYINESEGYVFYIMGGNRVRQAEKIKDSALYEAYKKEIENNTSAINYYKNAYKFTTWVNENLDNLTIGDIHTGKEEEKVLYVGEASDKIFANNKIEYPNSIFNAHRKEVIKYSIESNLSVAIANFNAYTSSGNDFQMPKLKDTEWEMLQSEVSIISFLQGINLGGKVYNGYTVVTNNKTEEVIREERIYITTSDGYFHKVNDKHFNEKEENCYEASQIVQGFLDLDFEIRKDGATGISYMQKPELGCYVSIVGQENVDATYESIYEYLQNSEVTIKLKNIYYTALGRERWGTYKAENPSQIKTILEDM